VTRRPLSLDTLVPPTVRDVVDTTNPVPHAPAAPLDERARDDLARILATPPAAEARRPRVRRPRRLVLTAAAATGLAAAMVVTGTGTHWPLGIHIPFGGSAYAATPPPLVYTPAGTDAAAALREIAARTAGLPDDTGTGRYAYVETRDWDLWTTVDGDRPVHSEVVESRNRKWSADDGSGRSWTRYRAPLHLPEVEDSTYGPGELGLMWPLRSLPADDKGIARALELGHPVENGPAERLVAIDDAYRQMPLPPATRAAVLRYLAATPGLELAGRVTDRAGRSGLAVFIDDDSGLPTRHTLIFDPDDGRLLGEEEMLTTRAGKLNVKVPSVIGYTTYLDSHYTDSTDD
jgi:hypothetical protein